MIYLLNTKRSWNWIANAVFQSNPDSREPGAVQIALVQGKRNPASRPVPASAERSQIAPPDQSQALAGRAALLQLRVAVDVAYRSNGVKARYCQIEIVG